MRKKLLTLAVATVAASSLLTGCGGSSSDDKKAASDENITAVSREDGSGTRGSFHRIIPELNRKIRMEIK